MSYTKDKAGLPVIDKASSEELDYSIDFTKLLADSSDSIISYDVIADQGVTISSHSVSGAIVIAWASGGQPGCQYKITFNIATSGGRKFSRTIKLNIKYFR